MDQGKIINLRSDIEVKNESPRGHRLAATKKTVTGRRHHKATQSLCNAAIVLAFAAREQPAPNWLDIAQQIKEDIRTSYDPKFELDIMKSKFARMMDWVEGMATDEAKANAAELEAVRRSVECLAKMMQNSAGLDRAGIALLVARLRQIAGVTDSR